jgi:hypothetical protein
MAETLMPEQPPAIPPVGSETKEKQEGKNKEQVAEQKKDVVTKTTAIPTVSSPVPSSAVPQSEMVKNETLQEIEHIMEDDLEAVYATLPADKRAEFQKVGEETAAEIEGMMYQVKVKSKKVFKLLFSWMKIIPGVNNYFLKQEAKTKTDEIMHLQQKMASDPDKQNQIQ